MQIDGYHHKWFEDRGQKCALLVFIDDASSELLHLEFAPSESSMAYMKATLVYVRGHGKPVAFYNDKHSVFRKGSPNLERNSVPTQFARALDKLRIGIINAECPQAKGRVERANRTLQDRLIREMRLLGISTIDQANAFVASYIKIPNEKFARLPAIPDDAHRPIELGFDLEAIFRWEENRTLTKSLDVTYDKRIFILTSTREVRALAGKVVTVCEYPDGRVAIEHQGRPLPCLRSFDKFSRVQPQVVSRKLLHTALGSVFI